MSGQIPSNYQLQFVNPYISNGNYQYQGGNNAYVQPVQEQVQNPYAQGFIPSTSDMELAQAYIDGKVSNPFASQRTQAPQESFEARGAAWEGYSVPENNGTGELRPRYEEDIFNGLYA